jgi:dethiobiotin synthetase
VTAVRGPVVVTGTDTGVGKTIVTAAIAAAATSAGLRVGVVKPCQTGTATDDEPDAAVIARLAAPASVTTLARYPDPLSPVAAARVAGLPTLPMADVVEAAARLAGTHDLVLIEGAGGLLVPMGTGDWTVLDLAAALSAPLVVVVRAGLGTLNHTALTRLAIAGRGLRDLVVVGSWPSEPELVHHTNLVDLPALDGLLPQGAGALDGTTFGTRAPTWLTANLHGTASGEFSATRG